MAERPDLIRQLGAYGDVLRAAEQARPFVPSPAAPAARSLRPGPRRPDRDPAVVVAAAVVVVLMVLAGTALRRSSEGSLGTGGGPAQSVSRVPAGPRFAPATVPPDLVPMAAADGWSAPAVPTDLVTGMHVAPRPPAATVQAFRVTGAGDEPVTLHVTVKPRGLDTGRETASPAVRGVDGRVAESPAPGGRSWSKLEWSSTSALIRAEALLPIAPLRAVVAALTDRPGGSLAGFDPPPLPVDGADVSLVAEHVAAPGESAPAVSRIWFRSTREAPVPGPPPARRFVVTSVAPVPGVAPALLDSEPGTVPTNIAGRQRLRWVGFDQRQMVTSLEPDGTETIVEASGLTDDEVEQVVAGLGPVGADGWAALRAAASADLRQATVHADRPLALGRVTSYIGGGVGFRGACLEVGGRSVCDVSPSSADSFVTVTTGAGPLGNYEVLRDGYLASVVLDGRWYVFGWRVNAGPVRTSPAAETAQELFGGDRFYVIAPQGDRLDVLFEDDRLLAGQLGALPVHPAYELIRPDP